MADRTTWRICRDNRWWSVFGKRRGRTKKAGPPVHDDLVRRDFTTDGPNRLTVDLYEHPQHRPAVAAGSAGMTASPPPRGR